MYKNYDFIQEFWCEFWVDSLKVHPSALLKFYNAYKTYPIKLFMEIKFFWQPCLFYHNNSSMFYESVINDLSIWNIWIKQKGKILTDAWSDIMLLMMM